MAFQNVTSMRSHRYPLAGLGCNCGASAPVMPVPALHGLGLVIPQFKPTGMMQQSRGVKWRHAVAGLGQGLGLDFQSIGIGGTVVGTGFVAMFLGWQLHKWFGSPRRRTAVYENRRGRR